MIITPDDKPPVANLTPRIVWCLLIDGIGFTAAGLQLSHQQYVRMNAAFIKQIEPHLENLDLTNLKSKFVGDGWLLFTDQATRVSPLCC